MARLIDADGFKRQVVAETARQGLKVGKSALLLALIDAQPTIDPVRHARWVCDNGVSACSDCGGEQMYNDWDELQFTPWCHNCGAIHERELSDKDWTCPDCGTYHLRDVNAAINIRNEGLKIA